MSLPLTRFFLTDPFTTPLGWKVAIPGSSAGAVLYVHNQTDTSMDVYGDGSQNDYLGTIPAELGFFAIRPSMSYLYLEFRPGAALNASSAPSAYVDGQYFAPGEPDPGYPMIGLSRLVNVGNNVTVGTSPILEGTGQTLGVTTRDTAGSPGGPGLIPASVVSVLSGTQLLLAALDGSGNPVLATALVLSAALARFQGATEIDGALSLLQAIAEVGGMATDGALGVAGIVKAPAPVVVTSTAAQNIISLTPPANGVYRAALGFVLNNAVSGNAITAQVSYQDATGVNRGAFFSLINGSTQLLGAGVSSFVNSAWACQPLTFYAKIGASITLVFRDPTNTPNDTVFAVLERLS